MQILIILPDALGLQWDPGNFMFVTLELRALIQ